MAKMDKRGDKKNLIIGSLLAVVMLMAVGYAALASTLNLNGTATIGAGTEWDIKFSEVTPESTGLTENVSCVINDGDMTADFGATFKAPGDTAVCTLTILNDGTIDAVLGAEPEVTITPAVVANDTNPIVFEVAEAPVADDELAAAATHTLVVTAQWPAAAETIPTETGDLSRTISIDLDYVQKVAE